MAGKRVALWFFGHGFRNRLAFEIGIRAMGGDVSFVPGELGVHEPLEDVGHYLQNWFSMIVVRTKSHIALERVVEEVRVPVVNARTEYNHPCEIVGDLQYIRQRRGSLDGLNVVFIGEVTNLCRSWFEAAVSLPISVIQVAPEGYTLSAAGLRQVNAGARGMVSISNELFDAVRSATDVLYTDCWPRALDQTEVGSAFLPYQVDTDLLARMNPAGVFLPCPPVTRGQEVSVEAMRSPLCLNYEAKEFLLHAQNAIMEFLFDAASKQV